MDPNDRNLLRPYTPEAAVRRDTLLSRIRIARALAERRAILGVSQAEVARLANTKQGRISEMESLRGNVRFDTLDRVSRALGLVVTLSPRDQAAVKDESVADTKAKPA